MVARFRRSAMAAATAHSSRPRMSSYANTPPRHRSASRAAPLTSGPLWNLFGPDRAAALETVCPLSALFPALRSGILGRVRGCCPLLG